MNFIIGKIQAAKENLSGLKIISAIGRIGEDFKKIPYMQHRGFSSMPKKDDKNLIIFHRALKFCLGTETTDRPELEDNSGEAAIYLDDKTYIIIKKDGSIEITSDKKEIKVNGDLFVSGNIEATKEISAQTLVPAAKITLSKHIHPTSNGPSSAPTPGI